MPPHSEAGTLCDRLMRLNREAFEAAHYTTASYLLAAALHEAQEHQAVHQLAQVQHVAEAQ